MKRMNFFKYYILTILFCFSFTACEIDNYNEPDCTIEGKITDRSVGTSIFLF